MTDVQPPRFELLPPDKVEPEPAAGAGSFPVVPLAITVGALILLARNNAHPINMAKKRTSSPARRKRRASGYTVGPARVRRRKMNGVARRSRGRIRSARTNMMDTVGTVAELGLGAVVGMVGVGFAARYIDNPYVRSAAVAAVGVGVAVAVPKMRNIGVGIAVGAVAKAGAAAIAQTSFGAQVLNGTRKLSPEKYNALMEKVKAGGGSMRAIPPTLSRIPQTLSRANDGYVVMG